MNYSVDVNEEYKKAQSTFLKAALLFSLILTIVIIGDVLLITLSGEEYLVAMIIAIVLTVLFGWFAIFLFTNIYGEINAKYRYFKGYDSGIKPLEEVEFIRQEKVLFPVNGLYVYPIRVRYLVGLNQTEKMIYSFDQLDCVDGDKLTIETYQRILIKAEKHL